MIQQTLQVGGHQNVHGGGGGLVEGAALVIHAGGEELREHVVAVGGADELSHGQTHALGEVPRQNVAEVAGGHAEMHRLADLDAPAAHQIGVGLEIVHDLGRQTADIDGVGGGEPHAGKLFFRAGGEIFFTPVWVSSKLPRTAHTFTLPPSCVTICACCTADTPPWG